MDRFEGEDAPKNEVIRSSIVSSPPVDVTARDSEIGETIDGTDCVRAGASPWIRGLTLDLSLVVSSATGVAKVSVISGG